MNKSEGVGFHYYLWQLDSYAKPTYIDSLTVDVYTTHPMPCTPSGKYCATFDNALKGAVAIKSIDQMDLVPAREWCLANGGWIRLGYRLD